MLDDATNVELTVIVEPASDESPSRIVLLTLAAANGNGIQSQHLLMLEEFGLRMPEHHRAAILPGPAGELQSPPADHPADGRAPLVPARATRVAARRTPIPQVSGKTYPRPPDAELVAAFKRLGGRPADIAIHFGVPVKPVYGWLQRARTNGILPRADGPGRHTSM